MPTTTNYGVNLPTVGADDASWGQENNDTHQAWDTNIKAVSNVANAALPKAGGLLTGALTFAAGIATQILTNLGIGGIDTPWVTTWIPTLSAGSGTITTAAVAFSKYKVVGKTVHWKAEINITAAGTGAGVLRLTAPVPVLEKSGNVSGLDRALTQALGGVHADTGSGVIDVLRASNATPIASGAILTLGGTYERT